MQKYYKRNCNRAAEVTRRKEESIPPKKNKRNWEVQLQEPDGKIRKSHHDYIKIIGAEIPKYLINETNQKNRKSSWI